MIIATIIWLVMTAIPAIKLAAGLALAAVIILFVVLAISFDSIDESYRPDDKRAAGNRLRNFCKNFKWVLPFVGVAMLLPSKEVSWYMVGGYTAETVLTSDTAKEFGGEAKDLMLDLLKEARKNIEKSGGEVPAAVTKALKGREA